MRVTAGNGGSCDCAQDDTAIRGLAAPVRAPAGATPCAAPIPAPSSCAKSQDPRRRTRPFQHEYRDRARG